MLAVYSDRNSFPAASAACSDTFCLWHQIRKAADDRIVRITAHDVFNNRHSSNGSIYLRRLFCNNLSVQPFDNTQQTEIR